MVDVYRAQQPSGPVATFLAEEARRVHIHRDVLLRQRATEVRTHAPDWKVAETSRGIEADEVIERYLAGLLREVRSG